MISIKLCRLLVGVLLFTGTVAAAPPDARAALIVRDVSGKMSTETYGRFYNKVQVTFSAVCSYWGVKPGEGPTEKIVVEYDNSAPGPTSFFHFRHENGSRIRVVKVYGGSENPHQLAIN
jgi:hypothetical protein